jgi:hypothetical protein
VHEGELGSQQVRVRARAEHGVATGGLASGHAAPPASHLGPTAAGGFAAATRISLAVAGRAAAACATFRHQLYWFSTKMVMDRTRNKVISRPLSVSFFNQ